jgi:hypothetical protein
MQPLAATRGGATVPEGTVHACEQYPRPTWASCWANSPKGIGAAPWQILDVNLFRKFPLTQDEFWHEIGAIGSSMKLCFQPCIERPKPTPYATWESVLLCTAHGLRTGPELKLLLASTSGTRTGSTLDLLLDMENLVGLHLLQSIHHAWT